LKTSSGHRVGIRIWVLKVELVLLDKTALE
jgi:hypothetical protein